MYAQQPYNFTYLKRDMFYKPSVSVHRHDSHADPIGIVTIKICNSKQIA